jgi:hypothetical protein
MDFDQDLSERIREMYEHLEQLRNLQIFNVWPNVYETFIDCKSHLNTPPIRNWGKNGF